ncbi:myosin regulatory light chain 12 [Nematocida minor]|uniref:myosin regulatory light chain 12 n=1 Tax=Nematocida minor TaxID=1912983 RepID=UPI00221F0F1E|nr:myosin regulatory light chain 12 [Nematocida minor]XP_051332067.1 myosin regulatory light chain 12 [Nematocida minor]KAI5188797.1 myosin regulatory light chain 12 [Nematocida minor]KAI5188901.1 myosin regulatory light chain 12 [Nematocida minor]
MNRRRRTARQSSNVFMAFTQPQILELKEIFNLLDSTADGFISEEDLVSFLDSIGAPLTNEEISEMMCDMGERFNFTQFLTSLCERLANLDAQNVIEQALGTFDPACSGKVAIADLKESLLQGEGAITPQEWSVLEKELKPEEGKLPIPEIAKIIKNCGLVFAK